MKNTSNLVLAVIAAVAVLLGIYITSRNGPDGDEKEREAADNNRALPKVEFVEGVILVRVPEAIQRRAGIETAGPAPSLRQPEMGAFAYVVDLQPLFEFRSRYNEFDADRKIAEAELLASNAEFQRLSVLRADQANISERRFQDAQAKWLADKARTEAAARKIENLRTEAAQAWGDVLVEAAVNDSALFEQFRSSRSVLLLVTLGGGHHLPTGVKTLKINQSGAADRAREAFYISPAPYTRDALQGETYYFQTERGDLRTGMQLNAWIPLTDNAVQGVIIPESAVVWYVDRPWVYVRKDADTFFRLPLDKDGETRNGWFVQKGLDPGDRIVIRGAQMLLSEEFRWSIPDEDDNP